MRVNSKKTQMLCIGATGNCNNRTFIVAPGEEKITSGNSLKILGFTFGTKPNVDEQVQAMTRKFYMRLWTIRHLMKAGIPNLDVLSLYKALIRPVLEFAAPAFHSILTATQTAQLKRLQMRAMKLIFGWSVSYSTALEGSGMETLESRREGLVLRFARKCSNNNRFKSWFLPNHDIEYATRRREKFRLKTGRTSRFQKNPIYHMTTLLNPDP